MTDFKISALSPATTVADSDLFEIVQGGTNLRAALSLLKSWLGLWANWGAAPAVTAASGSIGTVAIVKHRYLQTGKMARFYAEFTITGGSGAGDCYVTLPVVPVNSVAGVLSGIDITSNKGVCGYVDGANTRAIIRLADATTAAAAGIHIVISGVYETA